MLRAAKVIHSDSYYHYYHYHIKLKLYSHILTGSHIDSLYSVYFCWLAGSDDNPARNPIPYIPKYSYSHSLATYTLQRRTTLDYTVRHYDSDYIIHTLSKLVKLMVWKCVRQLWSVPLARQLWSKVLSAHREVAATALTLKQASSLADTAKTLAKTEPSSILSASWDDLMNHEKLVKQLAARGAVVRQLEAATDVQGSADAKAALQDACTQLAEWASSQLCPEFESILASLQSWAAETILTTSQALMTVCKRFQRRCSRFLTVWTTVSC